MRLSGKLTDLLKNKIVLFTASRYLSYGLLFVRGFLLAKFLGPYFFGIWGVITLYQQYISFSGLGLQYAINTELAITEQDQKDKITRLIGTSIVMTFWILCVLLVVSVVVQFAHIELFKSKDSYQYAISIFLIGALQHFQQLFFNIYRVYNLLFKVAVSEVLVALATLVVVFIFQKEDLLSALLISWIASLLISNILFIIKPPFKISLKFSKQEAKILLNLGLPLLFYSISFYLIMISSRTIISVFYDVEVMGYYSFANNIANATLLGINAIAWIFYPIIINKLKEGTPQDEVKSVLEKVTNLYSTTVTFVVFIAIILSPIIYLYLDKYTPTKGALNILLLAQAIMASNFAFNTLAIARKKQNTIAIYSFIGMFIAVGLGLLFAFLKLPFAWLAVSVFIGYMVFSILVIRFGLKLSNIASYKFQEAFPWSLQLSLLLFLVGALLNQYTLLFYIFGLFLFVFFRINHIKQLVQYIQSKIG